MKDVKKDKETKKSDTKKDEKHEKKAATKEPEEEIVSDEETEEEPDIKKPESKAKESDSKWNPKTLLFDPNNNPKYENWLIVALALFGAGYLIKY